MNNGGGLKNLDTQEVIGLIDNRTLPIKVRIEEGALGITIDATALTAPTFFLSPGGGFPSSTPVVLDLAPGTYSVQDGTGPGGVHDFEVTAAGDVSYAAEKEPYFDGVGTPQLTLVGYNIDIDATALTPPTYSVGGIGGFPTATVGTFTFLPGGKSVQDGTGAGGVHAFEVTEAGEVSYAAEKEPYFDGLNTSQLTLVGYDVIIDATVLTAATYFIGGTGGFPSADVATITLLPGDKSIQDGSGGVHVFEVTEAGLVTYAAGKEPFFDGLNTSQLTIVGYDVIIDATALVASTFSLGGIGSFSTTVVHTVTTLPGTKEFNSDVLFDFEVREEDGLLDYDTSLVSRHSSNVG